MPQAADLVDWIEQEYRVAAREMLRSISATGLEYRRPAFGQIMRPARGSVVASPVSGRYDPEPDYFFHWLRDSAAVIGAVIELIDDGTLGDAGHAIVADFVRFSLGLDGLDGRRLSDDPAYGSAVTDGARRYLRSREDMAEVHGDRLRMEARFNPDGNLDIIRWARPQLDGPAFRALVLMRYVEAHGASADMKALVDADLRFTMRHAGDKSFDIWEERSCDDYYTHSLQHQLLLQASARTEKGGDNDEAELGTAAGRLADRLDGHWSSERSAYLSATGKDPSSDRDVDFAVVLAALHGDRRRGPHSICDPRMQATLTTLEDVFAADYAINRDRPGAAPAMGRYRGDVYQSGGAFYFSTLGAAEFYYRLAAAAADNAVEETPENRSFLAWAGLDDATATPIEHVRALLKRGDRFMETVRRFTPPSGALSEQFDQIDGRQTSARHLAWSYAASITATAWRRRATAMLSRRQSG